MADEGLVSDDGDDSTTDPGTDDGTTDDPVFSTGFEAIAPNWLTGNAGILSSFLNNPRKFVVGAVLTAVLEGMFSIVSEAIRIIQLFLLGSSPATSSSDESVWGVVDIVAAVPRLLGGAGFEIGTTIIESIQALNQPIIEAAGTAGPLAPVILAVAISAEMIVVVLTIEYVIRILADVVPGLGGLV